MPIIEKDYRTISASQEALVAKNPPASAGDMRCRSDAWARESPWRVPWTEEHGRVRSTGLQRVGPTKVT